MFDSLKKYSKAIYRILLFMAAAALVIYIFPRQGKFRYEYVQGKPWLHETLIAPFDFPIYKSQAELKTERETILKNFKSYYVVDETAQRQAIDELQNSFLINSATWAEKYPFTKTLLTSDIENKIKELLQKVYEQGLMSLSNDSIDTASSVIMLVKNKNFEPYSMDDFFTYPKAYTTISSELFRYIDRYVNASRESIDSYISELQLNRYLKANITYDESRTEQERQYLVENISLTGGAVIAGQRIIDTGEIINEPTAKILDSLKMQYETNLGKAGSIFVLLGQGLLIMFIFLLIYFFLYYFRRSAYSSLSSVLFLLLMVIMMVVPARLIVSSIALSPYIIPFAIVPIIVRIFFDSRLSLFIHIMTVLLCAFFSDNSFQFVILQIPVGLVALFGLFTMVRRSQLVKAVLLIILTYSVIYTGLSLWQEGDFTKINYKMYGLFAINGGLILIVYPLIYIFEKLFGFLSDVTLVELSDTNHPLLRKLAEKAPGTFQHSIQVGNLAQEAVYRIGGNPLLVRTGAMYHDVGKMDSPVFFTENQGGGMSPHNNLSFEESAQVIIHHIESGVKMAHKEKLPDRIIDFIQSHHGTTKTKFFYNSYVNTHPDAPVDVTLFTYPGPAPFSKETAVLMMADSVEAASRSLKTYSDDEIDKLVENIINSQIADNQFIDAPITFKDIIEIKGVFKRKLKNIYHGRIEYPELMKKD
ncbi:MAG: HDIG domain-containing protein [Cytophagaceae bacterium]|jgi:putative nucleotidyltransferase with HDIG domain|nr:HDIG domain-containing protein [Cytophagaceae bacterium]